MSLFPLNRAILALRYPYQLDYAEGYVAVESWQLSRGEGMYPSLGNYPFLVGNYPPLYPLLCAPFFLAFGPSLFWGRLICVLSALGICAVMIYIIGRREGWFLPVVLSPVLFFCTYELYEWIGYARVDLPAIFLSILGLAFLSGEMTKSRVRCALVCFVLSLFTKQVQIFAPLSGCLYLILKHRKTGLRFTAWFVGLIFGIFILLSLLTRGQYYKHTVLYNANVYDWWQIKNVWLRHIFRFYPFYLASLFLVGMAAIFGWARRWIKERRFPAPDVFSIYAILGALSFFTIGKVGAASNYLLEFHAALCLFFGLQISRIGHLHKEYVTRSVQICLIVILGILINLHSLYVVKQHPLIFSRPNPHKLDFAKGNKMLDIIGDFPDPVLCEQPIFLLLSGKKVVFQPFIMSQLHKEGKWNQEAFVRDLSQKRFSLIVTGQDVETKGYFWQYTEEMIQAIREHYTPLLDEKSRWKAVLESPSGGIPYFIYIPKRGDHVQGTSEPVKD